MKQEFLIDKYIYLYYNKNIPIIFQPRGIKDEKEACN